jgi:hypothetical protein
MERRDAINALTEFAARLRLEMQLSNQGVLPPEILCIFAWEESILRRYARDYSIAPVDVKKRIDDAKDRCAETAALPYIRKDKDAREHYFNRIVKGNKAPAIVLTIPCPTCHTGEPVVSLMDNMADARPFWTYFLDFEIEQRHT